MWKLAVLPIGLAFAAIPAKGQQLIFGANVGGRWESNVNNVPNGESDFSARVGPEVRLRESQGDLTYDFHYVPTYQAYSRFASLDDWDQLVNANVNYRLGLNTVLTVRDLFDYAPAAANFLQQLTNPAGVPLGTTVVNAIGHYNVLVNTASLELDHTFSELWSGRVTASNFYWDPRVTNGITTSTTSGSGDLTYYITPNDAIGGSLGATAQQFGSNSFQNAATNYYYNASAIWNHTFSPTWSLRMSAGPTYVQSPSIRVPSSTNLPNGPFLSVAGTSTQNALFELSPPAGPVNSCTTTRLPSGLLVLNQCNGTPTLPLNSAGFPPSLLTVLTPTAQDLSAVSVPIQGLTQGSNNNLTYFANIVMSKHWETLTASLGYSRSAGGTNIGTSSAEVDTATGSLLWNTTQFWTNSLSVVWTDQSSSSNVTTAIRPVVTPFTYTAKGALVSAGGVPASAQTPQITSILFQQQSGTINIYQWILGFHSEYQLTKRLSIFGNVLFINQTSNQSGTQFNLTNLNLDSTRIDLGFHYEFDPIHL